MLSEIRMSKTLSDRFSCFDTIPACDGHPATQPASQTRCRSKYRAYCVTQVTRSSADADNRLDAFSGQSRSTNMVPFHILHIVSYCAIVTLSLRRRFYDIRLQKISWPWNGGQCNSNFVFKTPFLRYSSSKNFMTLKWGTKVTQGHWEWYHSIDCVWFPISVL